MLQEFKKKKKGNTSLRSMSSRYVICLSPVFHNDVLSKVLNEYLKVKTCYRFNVSDPAGIRDSFLTIESAW